MCGLRLTRPHLAFGILLQDIFPTLNFKAIISYIYFRG